MNRFLKVVENGNSRREFSPVKLVLNVCLIVFILAVCGVFPDDQMIWTGFLLDVEQTIMKAIRLVNAKPENLILKTLAGGYVQVSTRFEMDRGPVLWGLQRSTALTIGRVFFLAAMLRLAVCRHDTWAAVFRGVRKRFQRPRSWRGYRRRLVTLHKWLAAVALRSSRRSLWPCRGTDRFCAWCRQCYEQNIIRAPSPWAIVTFPKTVIVWLGRLAKWIIECPRAIPLVWICILLPFEVTFLTRGRIGPSVESYEAFPAAMIPEGGYSLKDGDTLEGIAETELGDKSRWKEIYESNKALFDALGPEGVLPQGTILKLPDRTPGPGSGTRPAQNARGASVTPGQKPAASRQPYP